MDFETLDKIADSYTPFLAIAFLVGVAARAFKYPSEKRFMGRVILFFAGLLAVSYGIMALDNAVQVWPSFNLDYSTHTAVSFALVLSICALSRQFRGVITGSFLLYVMLMLYQKYHTIGDILSTMIVIGLLAFLLARLLFSQAKGNKDSFLKAMNKVPDNDPENFDRR